MSQPRPIDLTLSQLGVEVTSAKIPRTIGTDKMMDVKTILLALTPIFIVACLFFGTRNGFYDTDSYHGNGSAH